MIIKYKGLDINLADLVDMVPWKKAILLRYTDYYNNSELTKAVGPLLSIRLRNDVEFERIKFKAIQFVKTRKDPDKRIYDFEFFDDMGVPDWDKKNRIIESRKSTKEKKNALDTLLSEIQQYKENNIDHSFKLEELEEKQKGS